MITNPFLSIACRSVSCLTEPKFPTLILIIHSPSLFLIISWHTHTLSLSLSPASRPQIWSGKPAPVLNWWSSDGVLLEDNYFLSSNGISQSELHLPNLNRSNLMNELICKASNTNLTQEISASTFIDLNREYYDHCALPEVYISSFRSLHEGTGIG